MSDESRAPAPEAAEAHAQPRPRRKGMYILPNAVSLAALFASFYSIVMAMNGRFETGLHRHLLLGHPGQP
jgi:CDP-diacylglycerol--serine O-phosphatidyltransferase